MKVRDRRALVPGSDPAAAPRPTAAAPAPAPAPIGWSPVPRPEDEQLRRLGVEPTTRRSRVLDALGEELRVPVPLVRVPGKVVWWNPELARRLGFDVPASNVLTAELETKLLDALSYRVLEPGHEAGGRPELTGFADKYGGYGIGHNKGAGRAVFLPTGNLNIKGVGVTPLVGEGTSFHHRHGGAPMLEGFLEAIWGEVGQNLFVQGSTQILAVIDHGEFTQWQDGGAEKRALIVRAGGQLRPGHVLSPDATPEATRRLFDQAATEAGAIVLQPDGALDVRRTMEALCDRHARTAAEQYRFRVFHGALSPSNMEVDGSMLDLGTIQTQPRTAPIRTLPQVQLTDWVFGREHEVRADRMAELYRAVSGSVPGPHRRALKAESFNVRKYTLDAYDRALEVQLAGAMGLKASLAEAVAAAFPDRVARLREAFVAAAELRNEGSVLADREVVRDVAVLDVFRGFAAWPERVFGEAAPPGRVELLEDLQPVFSGPPAVEKQTREKAARAAERLFEAYALVMRAAESCSADTHDDALGFRASVRSRARFENAPMDRLYRGALTAQLRDAIGRYQGSGDLGELREIVSQAIAASLRNTDALLGQGSIQAVEGGLLLQARTIEGVRYGVLAPDGGGRSLRVELALEGSAEAGFRLPELRGQPALSAVQVEQLRFRFSTDDWATVLEAGARVADTPEGRRLRFDIPVLEGEVGRLEGLFFSSAGGSTWIKDGASNFRGYVFAVPDDKDLLEIRRLL